jgi:hypothetical protein
MTRFIRTNRGYINLAHVAKITKRGGETTLYAPDGEDLGEVQEDLEEWEIVEALGAAFVPAPIGYSMVRVTLRDSEPPIISEEPIIGFRLTKHFPDPYTLQGREEVDCNEAVKCPDGKLRTPGPDWVCNSIEEFVDGCIK